MVKMLRGTMGGSVLNILFLALNIKRFCIWVTLSFFPKNSRDTFIYEKKLPGLSSTALYISPRNSSQSFIYSDKSSGHFDGMYCKITQRNKG